MAALMAFNRGVVKLGGGGGALNRRLNELHSQFFVI